VLRPLLVNATAADLAVARSILAAAGVDYVLRNEHALLVPLVGGTELLVEAEDEDKAVALLRRAGLIA
jgi:hypothetical protein